MKSVVWDRSLALGVFILAYMALGFNRILGKLSDLISARGSIA